MSQPHSSNGHAALSQLVITRLNVYGSDEEEEPVEPYEGQPSGMDVVDMDEAMDEGMEPEWDPSGSFSPLSLRPSPDHPAAADIPRSWYSSDRSSSDTSSLHHPPSPGHPPTPQRSPSQSSVDTSMSSRSNPILNLPFLPQFTILTDLSPTSKPLSNLTAQPMDVDRWEMVISPEEYLHRFKDTLATVQLICRAPHRKMHTTYHRGPAFDKWLLLGESNHQLWIDPRYKDAFFEELNIYQTAQPGQFPLQASLGNVLVPTSVFIHCLTHAGCDTLRLKAYGQKMPLVHKFLNTEPAEIGHRWAEHNEWDIGTSFTSPYIWLFASSTGRRHGVRHFPVMVPGSQDYGTVNLDVTHHSRHYTVKVYPRLVHLIKSFNSRLQASIPKTLNGVRIQVAAALRMIHSLTGRSEQAIGGFRIEVTVKARTLEAATELVKATGFLSLSHWLHVGAGPFSRTQLTAKLVTRSGFLDNANWVYQQANTANVFAGRGEDKPTAVQYQALTDILNGLGWNSGLRQATMSLTADAWWLGTAETEMSSTFQEISNWCQTDVEIRDLFLAARSNGGYAQALPCKLHPGDQTHRYQIHQPVPFRVRCSNSACQHKLVRSNLVHWIADLVDMGVIDAGALGLG